MKAVHLEKGQVSVVEKPAPRLPKRHALLRLRVGGICNTDLELKRGYYGFRGTPGHEFVADVVKHSNPGWIGRRVVGEINLACGNCDWCRRDLGRHCPNRTVLGIVKHPGAFQELFTLPEENLFPVPKGMPDEEAVFTEPVAAACEILDQVRLPDSPLAVLGDGKLGLLIAQVLAISGAEVHLYGRHAEKIRIAQAVGVRAGKQGTTGYALTVDATGSAMGLGQAIAMTRPRGTVVMKSTVHEKVHLDMALVIVNEISLVGSRCGRFAPALRMIKTGKLNLRPIVQGRFPLADAEVAFNQADTKGTLKILLSS